ncbi:MAG TPA: PIN domain-containing protein [Gammaproteobacteria bacterium]|nr:PIN domain-containing protein [Gammaproteobacteria bacterium]
MASLVDTNVLVCRFDPRDRSKQRIAESLLREHLAGDALLVPHQAIVEFVAAVSRPRSDLGGAPLLPIERARLEAEALISQFRVLYPTPEVLVTALRGSAAYQLSWFDAHLWAYAEVHGVAEILSENFEHGRHYGSVRTVNPFVTADGVRELPALYQSA